jgi:hypothetical protein
MQANPRDLACGLVFIAMGGFFALHAALNLRIGEATEMGPGYFPVMLGALLAIFGVAIALSSLKQPAQAFGAVPWRGVALIVAAVLTFAFGVRPLGMGPSLLAATFLAAMAWPGARPAQALAISLALTAFNVAVFLYALRLPYALVGPRLWG